MNCLGTAHTGTHALLVNRNCGKNGKNGNNTFICKENTQEIFFPFLPFCDKMFVSIDNRVSVDLSEFTLIMVRCYVMYLTVLLIKDGAKYRGIFAKVKQVLAMVINRPWPHGDRRLIKRTRSFLMVSWLNIRTKCCKACGTGTKQRYCLI